MRFTNKTVLALLAQAFLAYADNNSFNVPTGGYNATAGQSLTLNWTPTSSGTVSLILRSGASSDLDAGAYVAQSVPNSGSYTWSIPSDVTRGSDYAIEIVSDSDSSITNFTPYFVIESTNTVASSTSQISLGGSATASPSSTVASSVSSAISSANSVVSSASASASSALASLSSSHTGSATSSASSAAASASSKASSAASSATSAASSAASAATSAATANGAAMVTALPGLMGVLALGALAL